MSKDLTDALNNLTDELGRHRKTYDGPLYDGDGDVTDDTSDAPSGDDTVALDAPDLPDHNQDCVDDHADADDGGAYDGGNYGYDDGGYDDGDSGGDGGDGH